MLEILLLAIGLAMDASAVAAARGAAARSLGSRDFWLLPLLFGGFQAGMALLGWLGASGAMHLIDRWDHYLAFALLVAVGGKMLYEAWRGDEDEDEDAPAELKRSVATDLSLALATSLDAAAAGVSLPSLTAPPALSLTAIGVVTAALSAAAFVIGCRVGARLGRAATALGGLVLIGIAVRLLWSALAT